jgi:hypothetical protein
MNTDFRQRIVNLAQLTVTHDTSASILQECSSIDASSAYIPSGFRWVLDYKRYQVEMLRGNKSSALAQLRKAIAQFPYHDDILSEYRRLVQRDASTQDLALIISCKKYEAKAIQLAGQFDAAHIEYVIVTGNDTAPIENTRALQVGVPDSYEHLPKKVLAAFTWIFENLGTNVGVLKVDDDQALFDGNKLTETMIRLHGLDAYAGVPVSGVTHDRNWHWGKCSDAVLNTRTYGRPFWRQWAKGGAYYLGPGPLEKLVIAMVRFPGLFEGEYYEDKLVGDVLMFEQVELKQLPGYEEFGLSLTDEHRFNVPLQV